MGRELVALHLMELPKLDELITRYPVAGEHRVEKAGPKAGATGRVGMHRTQYFGRVRREL